MVLFHNNTVNNIKPYIHISQVHIILIYHFPKLYSRFDTQTFFKTPLASTMRECESIGSKGSIIIEYYNLILQITV